MGQGRAVLECRLEDDVARLATALAQPGRSEPKTHKGAAALRRFCVQLSECEAAWMKARVQARAQAGLFEGTWLSTFLARGQKKHEPEADPRRMPSRFLNRHESDRLG